MSKKYSYIYKISKEIHKGTEITSNPFEKLADHCVEHKINKTNDDGCDPRSQLYSARAQLSQSFFLAACFLWFFTFFSLKHAWLFIENSVGEQTNSPRQAIARLGKFVA